MRLSKYFNDSIYILIILLALSGTFFVSANNEKPPLFITKQQGSINIQNSFWQYFSLGQKRLASSLVWIATILESDHDHYKGRDLNSWMFLRFNTISFLEPMFYENYAFGGIYLSIVKDDLAGASIIYDRGLKHFPHDFNLLKNAGFHYYFEIGDFDKALPIYKKLKLFKEASSVMVSTLARIESREGNLEDAFNLLSNHYANLIDKESIVSKKIFEFMYSLKAEIDLNCLNSPHKEKEKCSMIDLENVNYRYISGKYKANKDWTKFIVKTKKTSSESQR